jgi:hypothetical protein
MPRKSGRLDGVAGSMVLYVISDVVLGANQGSQLRQEGRTGEGRNDYYENPRFLHAASTPLPITRNLTISATAI